MTYFMIYRGKYFAVHFNNAIINSNKIKFIYFTKGHYNRFSVENERFRHSKEYIIGYMCDYKP